MIPSVCFINSKNAKTVNNTMIHSFCIQNTDKHVIVALCANATIIDCARIPNIQTAASLICHMESLLQKQNILLRDCSSIAATQGPAPFSALRSVLATINGIQAVTSIPLIGIDTLKILVKTPLKSPTRFVLALLNAFNSEFYYALYDYKHDTTLTGYSTIEGIITLIHAQGADKTISIVGQAASSCKEQLLTSCSATLLFVDPPVDFPSIETISYYAYEQWRAGNFNKQELMPLYLKRHQAERL
jgi:tRNA threonylcarbamoyl adenosine modification protein YeaZ